jgi:hypothetical protein
MNDRWLSKTEAGGAAVIWIAYIQCRGVAYDIGTADSFDTALVRARSVLHLLSEPAAACARSSAAPPDAGLGVDLGRALCGLLPKDLQRRRAVAAHLWRAQIAVAVGEKRERRRRSVL